MVVVLERWQGICETCYEGCRSSLAPAFAVAELCTSQMEALELCMEVQPSLGEELKLSTKIDEQNMLKYLETRYAPATPVLVLLRGGSSLSLGITTVTAPAIFISTSSLRFWLRVSIFKWRMGIEIVEVTVVFETRQVLLPGLLNRGRRA